MKSSKIVTLDCGKLRIEWQYVEDRWQHAVGIVMDNNFCSLITSIEGNSDDHWPTSPALQEMHIESRGKDSVAFLTGMAGTSHWSASVLCEPQADRATIEIACRCKEPPSWLGSLYQTPEWLGVRHASQMISMSLPNVANRLIAQTPDLLGYVPQFDAQFNPTGDKPWTADFVNRVRGFRRTIFFAPLFQLEEGLGTIRWKYILEAVCG